MSIGQSAETLLLLSPKLGREKEYVVPFRISHRHGWLLPPRCNCKGNAKGTCMLRGLYARIGRKSKTHRMTHRDRQQMSRVQNMHFQG
jgi:hypothetical protein